MSDRKPEEAKGQWRTAVQRGLFASLAGYLLAYLTMGGVMGFTYEIAERFVIGTVVIWIVLPWVAFNVYADTTEGLRTEAFARVGELHWPLLLSTILFMFLATWLDRPFLSLCLWLMAGAASSYCFALMLLAAYDRGRRGHAITRDDTDTAPYSRRSRGTCRD